MQTTKVTICACSSRSFISKEKVAEIATAMINGGYTVSIVPDLCRQAQESSQEEMQEIASGRVLACHWRAVRSLFDRLGLETRSIEDLRTCSVEEVLARLGLCYSETKDATQKDVFLDQIASFPVENGTDAWYPVLDKTRCKECGKCHDFCLFGVYTIENKQVRVVQPENCKNNCPACARMCPDQAIIFPKYEKSPINGGMAQEETFHPEEMDKMYRDRLRSRLQQRRAGVSLLKNDKP